MGVKVYRALCLVFATYSFYYESNECAAPTGAPAWRSDLRQRRFGLFCNVRPSRSQTERRALRCAVGRTMGVQLRGPGRRWLSLSRPAHVRTRSICGSACDTSGVLLTRRGGGPEALDPSAPLSRLDSWLMGDRMGPRRPSVHMAPPVRSNESNWLNVSPFFSLNDVISPGRNVLDHRLVLTLCLEHLSK